MKKNVFDIFNIKKKNENKSTSSDTDCASSSPININLQVQKQNIPSDSNFNCTVAVTLDLGNWDTGPIRPKLKDYPKTTFGSQKRSFNAAYFNDFIWLEYSIKLDALFCFACRMFSTSNHSEDTFINQGFRNWKKLSGSKDAKSKKSKLQLHTSCLNHLNAMSRWVDRKQADKNGTIHTEILSGQKNVIESNRHYLKQLIEITLFLGRQGISFRAHKENEESLNRGNFKEVCSLISNFNEIFATKFQCKTNYTSWSIQNQLIDLCAKNIIEQVVNEIKECGIFSVMCDEARCFRQEQLSLCVRYTKGLNIVERFLGFIDVSMKQDSNALAVAMTDFFEKYGIYQPIVSQSYDGASVMSGQFNGVQQKIKTKHPEAIYIHCMAHKINLLIMDMCKVVKDTRIVFNCLESLYIYFSQPTNNLKFCEMQTKLGIKQTCLTRISDTRWNCRFKNCRAVKQNYQAIILLLKEEIDMAINRDVSQAIGILATIKSTKFIVNLFILDEVLQLMNILSTKFQQKSITLGKTVNLVEGMIATFEQKRSNESWTELWNTIKEFEKDNSVSISISNDAEFEGLTATKPKRMRKEPCYLNSYFVTTTTSAETEQIPNCNAELKDVWKIKFFNIVDSIIVNMKKRFSSESLQMAMAIDNFTKLNFSESFIFIDNYKKLRNIDVETLKSEMLVAKNCILHVNKCKEVDLEDLKKLLCDASVYPNLYSLLQVALAVPVSSATCERSFSAMHRIKTWLRTSMHQDRFSSLSLLHIERDISNNISTECIVNEFSKKDRRFSF